MLDLSMCPKFIRVSLTATLMNSGGGDYYYCIWKNVNGKECYTRVYDFHPRVVAKRLKSGSK